VVQRVLPLLLVKPGVCCGARRTRRALHRRTSANAVRQRFTPGSPAAARASGLAGAIELGARGAHVVISGAARKLWPPPRSSSRRPARRSARGGRRRQARGGEIAAAILKRHGRIDILVNSAGINLPNATSGTFRSTAGSDRRHQPVGHVLLLPRRAAGDARAQGRPGHQRLLVGGRYASTLTGPGYNAPSTRGRAHESLNMEEGANGSAPPRSCRRGGDADPRESARCRRLRRARAHARRDLGRTILFIATLPARACVNESSSARPWNRFYVGGLESPKS